MLIVRAAEAKAEPVLVGVLEHGFLRSPQGAGGDEFKEVRLAFRRTAGGWEAFPHDARDADALLGLADAFPVTASWTISFDGRSVGSVTTQRKERFKFYGEVGRLDVVGNTVPTVGAASATSPFLRMDAESVYRPLVATDRARFTDPQRWKPDAPDPQSRARALADLRARLPKVETCDKAGGVLPRRAYKDDEVRTVQSYRSKDKVRIVSLVITPMRNSFCEYGDEEVPDTLVHTFVIEPSGRTVFLGTAMTLVDAGDFDGDGQSELIFWRREGDNHEGYVLVADRFRTRIDFGWSYH
jgi:hypothetical protein